MLKIRILIIAFFTQIHLILAQDYEASVIKQFQEYSNLIINKEFDKAVNQFANEDYVQTVSKQKLIESMSEIFNSKELQFTLHEPTDIFVQKNVIDFKGKKYVTLNYFQQIDLKYLSKGVKSEDLLIALRKKFGGNNVKFQSDTKTFEIQTNKDVAASSKDLENWKFTVLDRDQLMVLRNILPEQIVKLVR